ncbi:MAG: glycerate kinase type-2 family protein, partial [Arenicellales bacterium]
LPLEGITLEEKRAVTKDLLISGATIHEINTVRKHLSRVKGGRLAKAAFPARTITLAISDVPGDDPSTIASGPTVGDRTTRGDAVDILRKYHLELPPAIDTLLASDQSESPNPDDASLSRTEYSVTATAADALRAAASLAQQRGFRVAELGDNVEGLAQDIAAEHARLFQDLQHGSTPSPFLMLSGGELTVRVNGMGRGGPNQEYLLALAIALDGRPDTFAIACDTDGIDGASTSAGALITPDTLARARSLGMHPQDYLRDNNAGAFFERLGDLVTTGPTCTNVNDFRAIAYIPGGD